MTTVKVPGHGRILTPVGQPSRAGTPGGWTVSCRCAQWQGAFATRLAAVSAYVDHRAAAVPQCGRCQAALTAETRAARSRHLCKPCLTEKTTAWADEHPDEWERHRRRSWLKRKYGITPEQYDALLVAQGGVCGVCVTPPADARGYRMHVDHDHHTGRVRGILCGPCNVGIGQLRDDPTILESAATYLRRHALTAVTG
jgi:hypothetical protein